MRLDLIRDKSMFLRKIAALGSIGAFLVTIALSDAPRLHERIHKVNSAKHDCAVTMFASGNCEHAAADPITVEAQSPPLLAAFLQERSSIFSAALEMSILEHAPPQNS